MTETYDTIVSKRDTRRFSGREIDEETLLRLVQAARMAGSAKAAEPVRLVLIREQAQKEALAACGKLHAAHPDLLGGRGVRARAGGRRGRSAVRYLPRAVRCGTGSAESDACGVG